MLGRARLAGGARLGASYGRGIAVGSVASRTLARGTNRTVLPSSRLYNKQNGDLLSSTESDKYGTYTLVKGSKVMYSRKVPHGHVHEPLSGRGGQSYENEGRNYVRHENPRGQTIGFDKIRLAKNIIEHYDANQKFVGQTQISSEQDSVFLTTDSAAIEAVESIEKSMGLNCPEAKKALDQWHENQALCLKHDINCGINGIKQNRYLEVAARCRAKNR